MKKRLSEWLDEYSMKRIQRLMPKNFIISLYKRLALGDIKVEERIINVKKGKRRYTLLILKDENFVTKYWLGRH